MVLYPKWPPGMEMRDDWLDQVRETVVDPDREIVDPHHHLWARDRAIYELDALWRDTGSGHKVVQTVYIECRSYYDMDAPEPLRAVGETAHVARIAAAAAQHPDRAQIAGIVANADLTRSDLGTILDAHQRAGAGLLRGIRHAGARDSDPDALMIPGRGAPGLYAVPEFRRGLAMLGARGLTYDTWQYHHQLPEFLELARAVPDTVLVLNHLSTPLGVGRFAGQRDAIFETWKDDMARLAECPNIRVKLGGMAMPDNGWGWHEAGRPPSSDEIVAAHGKWYRHMIACFGAGRCMFESNLPVDRASVSYPVLWNAFKKVAAEYDAAERDALFSGTARRVYGLATP